MEINFKGKAALVTGAGKGIGRAIAVQLLKCGADVVALSRTQADLDSLKEEHPSMRTLCVDLTDWEKSRNAVTQLGRIDLLVNNAAICDIDSALDVSLDDIGRTMDGNLKTAVNMSQVVAGDLMRKGLPGSIVNVSSILSMRAIKSFPAYSMSKGALDAATRSMALEFGEKNIRVNSVHPTVIRTAMSDKALSDSGAAASIIASIEAHTPLGRVGKVPEVVYPVLFLLSDYASMITGVMLPIDGGYTIC